MPFTRGWNEADPADTDDASQGAREIREFKTDIRERLAREHVFNSSDTTTADTGLHKWKITAVNANYTVQPEDCYIVANTGTADYTITLPDAGNRIGRVIRIINKIDNVRVITISLPAGNTFFNTSDTYINMIWGLTGTMFEFVSVNSTQWYVKAIGRPLIMANAYKTANESGFTTAKAVTWNAVTFDNGGFWSSANPTRFTIPVGLGIKRVIVCSTLEWIAPAAGTHRRMWVRKNGADIPSMTVYQTTYSGTTSVAGSLSSSPIPAYAGDYIEVWATTGGDGTILSGDRTFALIWVAEYDY